MRTFITSDLHFGHANIMKFCPATRGNFVDVNHMNESMISSWNNEVGPGDRVYILGDFAFLNADRALEVLRRLNGIKILIEGNHDRKLLQDHRVRAEFSEIHKYLDFKYNETYVVLFHYPIAHWDRMHHGSVHFHGHLHGNASGLEQYRARDMGFDATGKIVTLMEDAIADAMLGQIKGHH